MPEKTIRELEETFQRLHERLLRGEMSEGEFQAEVQQLRFRDDQGHPWRLGWYTGRPGLVVSGRTAGAQLGPAIPYLRGSAGGKTPALAPYHSLVGRSLGDSLGLGQRAPGCWLGHRWLG
jgi:hypothetical protein